MQPLSFRSRSELFFLTLAYLTRTTAGFRCRQVPSELCKRSPSVCPWAKIEDLSQSWNVVSLDVKIINHNPDQFLTRPFNLKGVVLLHENLSPPARAFRSREYKLISPYIPKVVGFVCAALRFVEGTVSCGEDHGGARPNHVSATLQTQGGGGICSRPWPRPSGWYVQRAVI